MTKPVSRKRYLRVGEKSNKIMSDINAKALLNQNVQPNELVVSGSVITYNDKDTVKLVPAIPQGFVSSTLVLNVMVTEVEGPKKGSPKPFKYQEKQNASTYNMVELAYQGQVTSINVSEAKLVTKVISSEYQILKTKPLQLAIQAKGEVPSGGWANPELSPYTYLVPPADGIQDFNFNADAPTGPATTQVVVLEAEVTMEKYDWIKGYRIHTASGIKHEVKF
jgi:hypothetical protein